MGPPSIALRPLCTEDAGTILAWMENGRLRADLGVRGEPSLGRTLDFIDSASREGSDGRCIARAILFEGRHVGNVVLDRIDPWNSSARFSIYVGVEGLRGRGIGRAATEAMAALAFTVHGLNKIWLVVHEENRGAIRAYENAGFRTEGRLREEFVLNGRRVDALYMGRLRSDPSGGK